MKNGRAGMYTMDVMEDRRSGDFAEPEEPRRRACAASCRNFGICMRVAPFVPLIGAIMIATALPVWAIYTRRALESSKALSDMLLGVRTFAVEQMSSNVNWVTGLGVIVISAIVGLCLLLSFLRTYQQTAKLPTTKCSEPSASRARVSFGTYITLISAINLGLWLMAVVVALLIAAQLCWLLLAFMFEAALLRGVKPIDAPIPPTAIGDLCPASCMNLGSFYVVFGAPSPCLCGDVSQYPALANLATFTWEYLVYALAALALMGLASLWLIMNLSAQFAHARRDLREARTVRAAAHEARRAAAAAAPAAAAARSATAGCAVYLSTNPTYGASPMKGTPAGSRRTNDHATGDSDNRKSPARAPPAFALPDSLINPAAPAEPPRRAGSPAVRAAAAAAAPRESDDSLLDEQVAALEAEAAAALGQSQAAAAANAQLLAAGGADSAGEGGGARPQQQYSSTAQRYAAYRLRAAQAANAGKSPSDRKWSR